MIKKILTLSTVLFLAQFASLAMIPTANAQVQKCRDAQGKWHYGNDLSNVCKNGSEIKQVKERIKTAPAVGGESASEKELARLELKVLNRTEYLKSELETLLAPYTTEQDVENRFEGLKANTTAEIEAKEATLEGLQSKQQALSADKATNPEKSKLLIADNGLRIKSTEADIRQLNVQLTQIEQRRTKVISLFRQFKDKLNDEKQAAQQG